MLHIETSTLMSLFCSLESLQAYLIDMNSIQISEWKHTEMFRTISFPIQGGINFVNTFIT